MYSAATFSTTSELRCREVGETNHFILKSRVFHLSKLS
jgi:hypothetical protein